MAVALARSARDENPDANVYTLGPIVHNKETLDELEKEGIQTLTSNRVDLMHLLKRVNPEDVVIFAAHGHHQDLEKYTTKHKIKTYDAICPLVRKNFDAIRREVENKHEVIWIGNPKHTESKAALSISKRVHPFGDYLLEKNHLLTDKSPFVLNQSTLNVDDLEEIYTKIKEVYPDCRINQSVCNVSKERQEAVKNLPDIYDAIIIVGDLNSANSNQLTRVAQSSHPNALVMQVSGVKDISLNQLQNKKHIAIASGAATPVRLVSHIYEYLESRLN